jgi:2,3-dihydroxybenzoate-AMP ligase
VARRYTESGYWRQRPLGDYVWEWAERSGDDTALVDGDVRLGYTELAVRVDALATNLAELGLGDGDNILVQLPNRWEYLVLVLACQRIGVAPVLSLMAHREHELDYLAELAGVKAIVVPDRWQEFDHQDLAAKIAAQVRPSRRVLVLGEEIRDGHTDLAGLLTAPGEVPARRAVLDAAAPDANEVALFLLSGGTTGTSKIIPRTHNDYELNARCCARACGFDGDTVYLAALPMAHNFPLGSPGMLGTLASGGTVVVSRSPRPEIAFGLIARERVTVTSLVPAVAQRWAEAAPGSTDDLGSLLRVQVGGSVMPEGFVTRLGHALGCGVQQVYGMAEGLINYTRPDDPPDVIAATQGRPVCDADEIRIVDESDHDVPEATPGELLTRGPYTPRGYFRADGHNARAFAVGGWYRTGDIVRRDPSGNLVVEGRIKDLVNRGGEKVSAPEVETVALSLPEVREAGVIPIPDQDLGERVCLCAVLRAGASLSLGELRERFAARGVAAYKIPERLEILDGLPLTPIGKVDKTALKKIIDGKARSV